LIDTDPEAIEWPEVPAAVVRLAQLLEAEADVEQLIDIDLDLFAAVRNAHRKASKRQDETEEQAADGSRPAEAAHH
jgi:hypothetical protein